MTLHHTGLRDGRPVKDLWVLETQYDKYKDFEFVFGLDKSTEYVNNWHHYGIQYEVFIQDVEPRMTEAVKEMLSETNFGIKLGPWLVGWATEYGIGGFKRGHHHIPRPGDGPRKKTFSMCMYFDESDELPSCQKLWPDEERHAPGYLYTLMPKEDGTQKYTAFGPKPGRVVMMDNKVWHGAYPTKTPRRVLVVDFFYDWGG